jgi:putative membrane protein
MSSEAPRRLARAGILVLAVHGVREAAFPLLAGAAALTFGGGVDADALLRTLGFALLVTLGAVVNGIVTWRTTSYQVSDGEIRHRRGVLAVRETAVPLTRVQSVDTSQGPLQRALGVVELQVQTAGGGSGGEIVLRAITPAAAQALREEAAAGGVPAATAAPRADGPRRRLTGRELATTALTAGQVGVILPVLAAASQVLDDLVLDDDAALSGGRALIPETAGEVALALLALLVLAWLLSALGAVIAFAGFTVAREGDRLRITRGLLQRRESVVPIARVQAVRYVEGLLRRPLRLGTLRVEVAGYATEARAAQTLHPLLARRAVRAFLDELLPELAVTPVGVTPPPRRSLPRYVGPPALLGLVVGIAAAALAPGVGPWAVALALPLALLGWVAHAGAGWRLDDEFVVLRTQRLARTTIAAPVRRLQEHSVRQSPLQQRAALADLGLAVGAGTRARVRHLEAATAWELWERLAAPRPAPPRTR